MFDILVLLSVNWNVNMVLKIWKFMGKMWIVVIVVILVVYVIFGYFIGVLIDDFWLWVDVISFVICLMVGVICFFCYNN